MRLSCLGITYVSVDEIEERFLSFLRRVTRFENSISSQSYSFREPLLALMDPWAQWMAALFRVISPQSYSFIFLRRVTRFENSALATNQIRISFLRRVTRFENSALARNQINFLKDSNLKQKC